MNLSISRSWENIWVWLFWGLGIYLALELGPFLIAARVLNKTAEELVGPYLAFTVPAAVFMPLVWWLRKWGRLGASPKQLARGWGTSMACWFVVVDVAFFYCGVRLGLMNRNDALGALILSLLLSVPTGYFTLHYMVIARMSSRRTPTSQNSTHER